MTKVQLSTSRTASSPSTAGVCLSVRDAEFPWHYPSCIHVFQSSKHRQGWGRRYNHHLRQLTSCIIPSWFWKPPWSREGRGELTMSSLLVFPCWDLRHWGTTDMSRLFPFNFRSICRRGSRLWEGRVCSVLGYLLCCHFWFFYSFNFLPAKCVEIDSVCLESRAAADVSNYVPPEWLASQRENVLTEHVLFLKLSSVMQRQNGSRSFLNFTFKLPLEVFFCTVVLAKTNSNFRLH